jgi:hypothetical protein
MENVDTLDLNSWKHLRPLGFPTLEKKVFCKFLRPHSTSGSNMEFHVEAMKKKLTPDMFFLQI